MEQFNREHAEKRREKRYITMRSVSDYGMGLLIIGLGVFFLFSTKITKEFPQFDDPWMRSLGGVAIAYGIFRIYRGYKKNYINER